MSQGDRPYRIEVTRAAARGLAALPRRELERIDARIRALADEPRPRGVEKLVGRGDLYRVRSGDYRVVYSIDDDARLVVITAIGHRRDIYQR
jgi:mRNA interferase RelE/StbE